MIFNAYQDTEKGLCGLSVVSCGHIYAQKGRKIHRPNGRSDFLLFYVAKGKEHFFLTTETVAEEGAYIFFRPFEKQEHIYMEDKPGEFYYLHFKAPEAFDLLGFESSKLYESKPSAKLCDIFEEIINELQTKRPAYEEICAAGLFRLLALLKRKAAKDTYQKGEYSDKISFVIQTMNRSYEKNYTLEDYAAMCGLSKFHFLRIFKTITGTSPMEYRNKIRLDHAKELLEDTDSPIGEIGRKVGYPLSAYFCDAFKNKVGLSPRQYRNQSKKTPR